MRHFILIISVAFFVAAVCNSPSDNRKNHKMTAQTIGQISQKMPNQFVRDVLFCAATAYGEARSEGAEGMHAVLNVVQNRLKSPATWWKVQDGDNVPDNTLAAVCVDRAQFSCWNESDPNSKICRAFADPDNLDSNLENREFRKAFGVAFRAVIGALPDVTSGSTHYHTKAIRPMWLVDPKTKKKHHPVLALGQHLFYNTVS